jgi:hypothetical protein
MKQIAIILICLLLVAAVVSPVFGLEKPGKTMSYVVSNPNHTQELGGKSENACKGLRTAAEQSHKVELGKPGK